MTPSLLEIAIMRETPSVEENGHTRKHEAAAVLALGECFTNVMIPNIWSRSAVQTVGRWEGTRNLDEWRRVWEVVAATGLNDRLGLLGSKKIMLEL